MHVAVGIVFDQDNKLLIAERPLHKTKAGFWEFPGGKVEEGETVFEALKRELQEEVGICIDSAKPLLKNQEGDTLLDAWIITAYTGNPFGAEGQVIRWIDITELDDYVFPEGNKKIIEMLKLKQAFNQTVNQAKIANVNIDENNLSAMVDEAIEWARKK